MIDTVAASQLDIFELKSTDQVKKLGQYFTSDIVANFMASLVFTDFQKVRILDAGAGAGILTIAAVFRCIELGVKDICAVLYEIDEEIINELRINMDALTKSIDEAGVQFSYKIIEEDFVLHRADLHDEPYDISIINPPYFKYSSKTSIYANCTTDLFKGNPNIYASFMAIALGALKTNGQLVAIVPRSFTNGLYFKGFRKYLLGNSSLERVHLFKSRSSLFERQKVLQENIICSFLKRPQSDTITVSTSSSYKDLETPDTALHAKSKIIDSSSEHKFIRIPEDLTDSEVLDTIESWESSFEGNGYLISTGPVVEFRVKESISVEKSSINQVPLLKMRNIKPFKTVWDDTDKKNSYIEVTKRTEKIITKSNPYLLLKRFSSKEEKRRLTAGIYDPKEFGSIFIGIENHLNYIYHKTDSLTKTELNGLAILFNSTIFDRYFRCISGNTQVNATEIRTMKLPSREDINSIGRLYQYDEITTQLDIDRLLSEYLN